MLAALPDDCIDLTVTSPPYDSFDFIIWPMYNNGMRNEKGQFIKGSRDSIKTEFKPGQHWRPHRPHWDKEWLLERYVKEGMTASEIATLAGCSVPVIYHWLRKHDIPRRSISEARSQKHWGQSGESNPMFGRTDEKSANWKGGLTPERQALYSSREWADAVKVVWKRDNGLCQRCGKEYQRGVTFFHIHHIVSFSASVELRAEPSNLVLLCTDCHRWVHSSQNTNKDFVNG
jgi:hypothetical protein